MKTKYQYRPLKLERLYNILPLPSQAVSLSEACKGLYLTAAPKAQHTPHITEANISTANRSCAHDHFYINVMIMPSRGCDYYKYILYASRQKKKLQLPQCKVVVKLFSLKMQQSNSSTQRGGDSE